ncbi:hypothetical protein B1J93_04805 [Leptospira kirschneri serovar Pomona]|uniref:Uncharacterized protein n=1 Tax=Leptospira kirschneri serovar Pomona TaxID=561005 RepID=A0A1T1DY28_9LEPT|nr:hypothetical protein B1J93_04805 [Leptospira kirschneri serovar Pomona]
MNDEKHRSNNNSGANTDDNFVSDGFVFIREFRHWRSKEIIKASDYGHKYFRIPIGKRKKKK